MSLHAKSVIAAFVAVVYTAITGWQQVTAGGFRWVDLIPLAVIVTGAAQTYLAPNVPELPWMKALVAGSAAVLSALATLVAQDPAGVTASKLLTAGAGAFLVWFVPEFGYTSSAPVGGTHLITDAPAPTPPTPAGPQEITDALRQLEQIDPQPAAAAPAPPEPAPVVAPVPAELAAPSLYDQIVAEHAATLDAITAPAPAPAPVPGEDAHSASMGPDAPAVQPPAVPDPAPPTAPMAAVAAGVTPAVPANA